MKKTIENCLGLRIKSIREEKKLTQAKFAGAVGVKPEYISQLETGSRKNPSDLMIGAICSRFGITKNWLLDASGEKYMVIQQNNNEYDLHGEYEGHTIDELTMDYKMSNAVSMLMKIYDSRDKKIIRIVNKLLKEFCETLDDDEKVKFLDRRSGKDRRQIINPNHPVDKERRSGIERRKTA